MRSAIVELYTKHIIRMTGRHNAEELYHNMYAHSVKKLCSTIQKTSLPKVVKNGHPLPYRYLAPPIGNPPLKIRPTNSLQKKSYLAYIGRGEFRGRTLTLGDWRHIWEVIHRQTNQWHSSDGRRIGS